MTARNEPCPCGSGKKYKSCCIKKRFTYEEDASGTIRRSVPMSDELTESLKGQLGASGDDVDPNGLLFPGLQLEHAEFEMVQAMEKAGINPAIIYAFQETGLMLTEENLDLFTQIDIDLWQSKIEEYHRKNGSNQPAKFPIGTTALYGPDDKRTTKIVAAVLLHDDAEPILERFVGSNILDDEKVAAKIKEFFVRYKVVQVIATDGNIGCPHEEGEDYPVGGHCPFCPFWRDAGY
jgi:hypothetical protein